MNISTHEYTYIYIFLYIVYTFILVYFMQWSKVDNSLLLNSTAEVTAEPYPGVVMSGQLQHSTKVNINKAIRDGKYLALPHASAWQRSPIKIEHFDLCS